MGDRKLILFELHMDGDLQVGPRTLPGDGGGKLPKLLDREGDESASEGDAPEPEGGDSEGRGRFSLAVGPGVGVLALGLLVGVVLAVRFLRGGSEEVEAEEDLEVDVEE